MSRESITWLNTMVLVGMGHRAWHRSEDHQGAESNHYAGPIPYEDVVRRLFHWEAVPGDVTSTGMNEHGVFTVTDPNRKTMLRPPGALGPEDTGGILGVFSSGYEGHQYKPWLLDQVKDLVEAADVADLGIGSAALLEQGGVAFVSIETPEWLTTPEGIEYKPRLLCVTSFNGSKATTYKFVIGNAVCDNTMSACLREQGAAFRVKHTRNSALKINDARAELGIMFKEGASSSRWRRPRTPRPASTRPARPRPRPRTSARPSTTCGATTSGSRRGPAVPGAWCRRSTPTRTTWRPCAASRARSATPRR
jgi:phage/plasmid-like protein (TIGR03299 family)